MTRHRFFPAAAMRFRGQALTEFLVLSVAILPLFLLIPLVGKYQDIANSAQMASRYMAFDAANRDATVPAKNEAQLAAEVRRRYFGSPGNGIESDLVASEDAGEDSPVNPRWTNPHGGPLIRAATDIAVSFGVANATLAIDGYQAASDGTPFNRIALARASQANLSARGIFRANVDVALANLPAGNPLLQPFDRIDLRIARQTSVLADAWTADSPDQVQQRSGKLAAPIPASGAIESILALAIPVVDLVAVKPPRIGQLDAWRDVVPADRLQATAAK